jgi:hypothetical protein
MDDQTGRRQRTSNTRGTIGEDKQLNSSCVNDESAGNRSIERQRRVQKHHCETKNQLGNKDASVA